MIFSADWQVVFFHLLRAGLWGKQPVIRVDNISTDDWAKIYKESISQTVSGLVYAGITNATYIPLPDDDLLAKLTVRAVKIADYNKKVNNTISLLAESLNAGGIAPVLLKGQATASLYKDPTLRESGDIDFFFQNDKEFVAAREIIEKEFITERKNDGSYLFNLNGVAVELHSKMFDMVSPSQQKLLRDAVSAYGFRRIERYESPAEILTPAPVLNMLMQNLHILRHALGFGIGLRQLCDYAVCYRHLDDNDRGCLTGILDKMNLQRWDRVLMNFTDTYLHCNVRSSAPSPLYKIVMDHGNFGFNTESRSWRQVLRNNARLFTTAPRQSLTTLYCMLTRQ